MKDINPTFQEVAGGGDISTAFADAVMAASGYTASTARKRGRSTTSVDNRFDQHFNRVANVENARVLERLRADGTLGAEDRLPAEKRSTQYDAVIGIYNANERFRPTLNEVYKLGNQLADVIGWENEITLAGITLAHKRYVQEAYLNTPKMGEYVTIDMLNPADVEAQAEIADSAALEAAEAV